MFEARCNRKWLCSIHEPQTHVHAGCCHDRRRGTHTCGACPGHPSLPDRKFVRMQHLMRRHSLLLHSGRPDEPCLCPGCPHAHAGPALHSPPSCSSSLGRLRPAVANSSAPAEAAGSTAPKDILLLFNWPPACKPDAFAPVTRRLGTSPAPHCVLVCLKPWTALQVFRSLFQCHEITLNHPKKTFWSYLYWSTNSLKVRCVPRQSVTAHK